MARSSIASASAATGFALLVDADGRLLAHGNPDEKPRVARGEYLNAHPLIAAGGDEPAAPPARRATTRATTASVLGVVQPVDGLGWRVIVEQPTVGGVRAGACGSSASWC